MKALSVSALAALWLALITSPVPASGDYWLTPTYLDSTTGMLKGAPEFFWHEEVQRLAEKYRDRESAGMKVKGAAAADGFISQEFNFERARTEAGSRAATAPDLADFAEALKTGRLKPADAAAATEAHRSARAAIDAGAALPGGEADSEFADYHAGAAARDVPAANSAWQKLLARPKEERHYRSVWAAFMLGKNALKEKKWPDAVQYFQQCRTLVRDGFADSSALAADSYGWEGRAELLQRHYSQAARLYLTQLALGDFSAVVSLKRCLPEYYGPGGDLANADEAAPPPGAPETDEGWLEAARDPVLQELTTARVLSAGEFGDEDYLSKRWLEALAKAGVTKLEDAGRLAWVAYHTGDYPRARNWLGKTDAVSPASRWLEARFAARDGKLEAAAKIMQGVAKEFADTGPAILSIPLHDRAHGELGMLLYGKGKFLEAFDEFLKGNCSEDTDFMIESVLTYKELTAILAKNSPPQPAPENAGDGDADLPATAREDQWSGIRWQIARRLVREGKVKEGCALLYEEDRKAMDDYIALAVKANNKKTPAEERALAHWEAGVLMLEQGPQFRGTGMDFRPPWLRVPDSSVRTQRMTGSYDPAPGEAAAEKRPRERVSISATPAEKKRLAATAKHHAKAMRTRRVAANHLLAAADLVPADKPEVAARLLNAAGRWLQDFDNPAADRIYYRIEREFADTPTGKAVIGRHWFTYDELSPWRDQEPPPADGVDLK